MANRIRQAGSCSIIGDRSYQQDSLQYIFHEDVFLAAVCDGMGGMSGGELASAAALQCIFDRFRENTPAEEHYQQWLQETFEEADRRVCSITDYNGNQLGAGSTVVAVIVRENRLYWGSVGDSRIYYIDQQNIYPVNRDHNYHLQINEMLARNEITEEQALTERLQGEALISFLGMGGLSITDVPGIPVTMQAGSMVLLCSDGLYKSLNDQQIRAIMEESGGNMTLAAQRLCNDAYRLASTKQDNTSAIAIIFS